MWLINKLVKSFHYAIEGLWHAYRVDKSFMLEVTLGLPMYICLCYYLWPLQPAELILLIGSYLLILIVELINTAFEKMLDRLHPDQHVIIKRSKDIAAGAVLVAFMFATFVIGVLVYDKLTTPHSSHPINQFMLGSVAV